MLLGATRTLWHELRPLLAPVHKGTPITPLDVATGDAHVPRRIAAYARRVGYALRPYASDVLVEALRIGDGGRWTMDDSWWLMAGGWCLVDRSWVFGLGSPNLICHDALHIPAADGAFDIVTCSLALHHFGPAGAAALLRELARVARVGAVLIDLQRTWLAYLGAHLMALGPWGAMARHDGPLSVLRAYTPDELRGIIEVSGVTGNVRVVSPLLISIVIAGGL
jgi:SAM-dependent methyltransferase